MWLCVNFHEISLQHDELPGKCRRIRYEHAHSGGVAGGGGFIQHWQKKSKSVKWKKSILYLALHFKFEYLLF